MAHVDYEGAWVELSRRLRAKPGWGARELHELMAEVAADHEVPEDLMQRALRLYGGSLNIKSIPETETTAPGESRTAESKPADPGSSTARERSHDGDRRDAGPQHEHEDAGGPGTGPAAVSRPPIAA